VNADPREPARTNAAARRVVIGGLLAAHVVSYVLLAILGTLDPAEPFNLLLLGGNLMIGGVLLTRREYGLLVGGGVMFLIAAHTFAAQFLGLDDLTLGALLMVNIIVLYVGVKINTHMPRRHWYAFVLSYFLLFAIFLAWLQNAEALFLLFLLGLAACARSLRHLAYFWTLTLSFTFCQPYAWEAAILSVFFLTAVFRAHGRVESRAAVFFLAWGLAVLLILLLPVAAMILREGPHNIKLVLRQPSIRKAILTTAWTATVSTLFLVLFAVPLAYAVSRLRFPGRTLLLSIIDLPIVVPPMAAGIALAVVFSSNQFLGEVLKRRLGIQIDGTALGVCLAQVFVAMPFLAKSALSAFDAVPERLEIAARVLGASSLGAFRRVTLPLASRGIWLGAILAWARAAGEFGAVYILAETPSTAPIEIYQMFDAKGLVETGPLVVTLILFSLAVFFLLHLAMRALPVAGSGDREEARA